MPLEINQLSPEEVLIINQHLTADAASLALKLHSRKDIDGRKVVQQILARQKAKNKLPDWYARPDLIFPPPVSVEQASSQATAAYKSFLWEGKHLIDLTLGMGVDSLYFSKRFERVTGYELNPDLALVTAYNLNALGADNITVVSDEWSGISNPETDAVFIDPSRRDTQKRKTVAFEDSSPNVLTLLPELIKAGKRIMIKSSPLIDIDLAVSQLARVSEVHVVGYQKECKEILFIIDPAKSVQEPIIHAVLIGENGDITHRQTFTKSREQECMPVYGDPEGYLFEPHPSFLKAGGFKLLAKEFNLYKVARNSHLYYSNDLRTDFPGRLFKITGIENASGFSWKKWLKEGKANLTIRNFPAHPDDLRKKWRLKEGGHDYLFATTLSSNKKVVIVTQKTTT